MDGAACVARRAPILYAQNNRPLKCADMSSLDPPAQCRPAPDDCVAFDASTGQCTVCTGCVNDRGHLRAPGPRGGRDGRRVRVSAPPDSRAARAPSCLTCGVEATHCLSRDAADGLFLSGASAGTTASLRTSARSPSRAARRAQTRDALDRESNYVVVGEMSRFGRRLSLSKQTRRSARAHGTSSRLAAAFCRVTSQAGFPEPFTTTLL